MLESASLILLLGLLTVTSLGIEPALAHVFLPDKDASLLALSNQLKSELKLVNNSLEQSDKNLALKHLADTKEIQTRKSNTSSFFIPSLDKLHGLIESMPTNSDQKVLLSRINGTIDNVATFIDTEISAQVDAPNLENSTIQALNIANMTDEILREYAIAYGIEPILITSGMGNLMNINMLNMSSSTDSGPASMEQVGTNLDSNTFYNVSSIANVSNYQNAQELAYSALEIFRNDLKPLDLPNTTRSFLTTEIRSSSVSGLEEGLSLLLYSINDKKPFSDIMQIIHGPIHTNLFLAYDLKMVAE